MLWLVIIIIIIINNNINDHRRTYKKVSTVSIKIK